MSASHISEHLPTEGAPRSATLSTFALGPGVCAIQWPGKGDLHEWASGRAAELDQALMEHGALLFRGARLRETEDLASIARLFCAELFDGNGEHPRAGASQAVYTPVFYPEGRKLLWHNENSFNLNWPLKILFGCVRPADHGGETPIVDSREVYRRLDPEVRRRFEERGVMYVRNYHEQVGLDWQTVFQKTSTADVEASCREQGIEFEWTGNGALRTRWVRPAVVKHPVTGTMSWFNQAQHWHPACLEPNTRAALAEMFADEDLPRNCFFGDGSVIDDDVMTGILDVYQSLEVAFPWRAGDILVLDNVAIAHARNPYSGTRKLLVAMGDMRRWDATAARQPHSTRIATAGSPPAARRDPR